MTKPESPRLTFIGTGNMCRAIVGGLRAKQYPASALRICGPDAEQRREFLQSFGTEGSADNAAFLPDTDLLLLCVKPQVMEAVCRGLRPALETRPIPVLSIAAGVSTRQISEWLGLTNGDALVMRAMPNTPAMVFAGITGLFVPDGLSEQAVQAAEQVFEAVGTVHRIEDEEALHAITALSGSGPAYAFLFMEALAEAGTRLGLPDDMARHLAVGTIGGGAELARQSDESLATLRQRVTSPGGTTEQAIAQFERDDLRGAVERAVLQAWQRSYTLAGEKPPSAFRDKGSD